MAVAVFTITGWEQPASRTAGLTPRGRAVLAAVSALCVCLAAAVLWAGGGAAGVAAAQEGGASEVQRVHTVVPGDTLWAIASRLDPGADPRPMVDRIQALNGLAGSGLQVGQKLRLPSLSDATG